MSFIHWLCVYNINIFFSLIHSLYCVHGNTIYEPNVHNMVLSVDVNNNNKNRIMDDKSIVWCMQSRTKSKMNVKGLLSFVCGQNEIKMKKRRRKIVCATASYRCGLAANRCIDKNWTLIQKNIRTQSHRINPVARFCLFYTETSIQFNSRDSVDAINLSVSTFTRKESNRLKSTATSKWIEFCLWWERLSWWQKKTMTTLTRALNGIEILSAWMRTPPMKKMAVGQQQQQQCEERTTQTDKQTYKSGPNKKCASHIIKCLRFFVNKKSRKNEPNMHTHKKI